MIDDRYLDGDPTLIWQDQIAGTIDYDYSDFIGALADLQGHPAWRDAFRAVASAPGMPAFLDRLQEHFDLCRSPHNEDGSVTPYQHPSRTTRGKSGGDGVEPVELMRRYLRTVIDADTAQAGENADRWRALDVVWMDDPSAVDDDSYARDGLPAGVSVYDTMGNIADEEIAGAPAIMSELREACYGLASDYELQRYLMQSFYTHSYDVDSIYALTWVHGCDVYFDETTCYVYDRSTYDAWKRPQEPPT